MERAVDAIVDTGFTGHLTLPMAVVTRLGLTPQQGSQAVMADGVVRPFNRYAADVSWDGVWRPVLVYGTGREPLVGLRLLAGHELRFQVAPGGEVEVTRLP